MSIRTSTYTGKEGFEAQIKEWVNRWHISKYDLKIKEGQPVLIIDCVDCDVNLSGFPFDKLPDFIQFGEIIGGHSFICSHSELQSMRGFPHTIGGNLDCSFSKLQSIDIDNIQVNKDVAFCGLHFTEEEIRSKIKINPSCRVFC